MAWSVCITFTACVLGVTTTVLPQLPGQALVCRYSTRNGLFDFVPKLLIPSVGEVAEDYGVVTANLNGFFFPPERLQWNPV